MIDLHVHSSFSFDSDEPIDSYIKKAIIYGSKVLGFSEHYDFGSEKTLDPVELLDLSAYSKVIEQQRDKHGEKIELLKGIEFGYMAESENEYIKIDNQYEFDYIINSVHYADKSYDCSLTEYFLGKNENEAYLSYLNAVKNSVHTKVNFQILGHLGYVLRNSPFDNKNNFFDKYSDIIEDILKELIIRDACLEMNTRVNSNLSMSIPFPIILKRYSDLGGKNVVISSDSHRVEELYNNYDKMRDYLLHFGFKRVCYFKNKKLFFEKL